MHLACHQNPIRGERGHKYKYSVLQQLPRMGMSNWRWKFSCMFQRYSSYNRAGLV